ncbi:MAG: thioredoxin domain-containing protein [Phycisphaerae bacterium]
MTTPTRIALLAATLVIAFPSCAEDRTKMNPTDTKHTNRLIEATSPYLLQHAHNPVDWHEWNEASLRKAKDENKPIFLSIGYAACHWCHVMAHESFEDETAAAIMNKYFVNIKVDREERPDLDEIYMQATMMMNRGQGGWPMSVWMTPDHKPFFAGTYFPPEPRYGRPGFPEICERIGKLWESDLESLSAQAEQVTDAVRQSLMTEPDVDASLSLDLIDRVSAQLAGAFDPKFGGTSGGGTNKFPPSMAMDLMLRTAHRLPKGDATRKKIEEAGKITLNKMYDGGIFDHLAGGIARYSTDVEWHVPHFEKMLYDQALVSRIYIDAYQYFGDEHYKNVAKSIFDYVLADLQSDAGGIYSTRDADSEGEEGKYYVWTKKEITDILGDELAPAFIAHYDVQDNGNWEGPHAPGVPKNVLRILHPKEQIAKQLNASVDDLEKRLHKSREKLLEAREKRVPPGLDDKILAEWNGMMISALARGGAVFNEQKYIDAARRAADFVLTNQYVEGRLLRAYRDGRKLDTAFLTDYANMIEGLIELYEATFEPRWLETALALNEKATDLFWDENQGGYFFTPDDHETLLTRTKDLRDSATPSGNSVQTMNLLRLAIITGDERIQKMAERTIQTFAGEVQQQPFAAERFLSAIDFAYASPLEFAIVGPIDDSATQALVRTIRNNYIPNKVIMLRNTTNGATNFDSPLLQDRPLVDGKPAVYVCQNYTCKKPVTTPDDLAKLIN